MTSDGIREERKAPLRAGPWHRPILERGHPLGVAARFAEGKGRSTAGLSPRAPSPILTASRATRTLSELTMKDLLPPWGWAVFGVLGLFVGALYLALGESMMTDYCAKQRYLCKDSNHAFE